MERPSAGRPGSHRRLRCPLPRPPVARCLGRPLPRPPVAGCLGCRHRQRHHLLLHLLVARFQGWSLVWPPFASSQISIVISYYFPLPTYEHNPHPPPTLPPPPGSVPIYFHIVVLHLFLSDSQDSTNSINFPEIFFPGKPRGPHPPAPPRRPRPPASAIPAPPSARSPQLPQISDYPPLEQD